MFCALYGHFAFSTYPRPVGLSSYNLSLVKGGLDAENAIGIHVIHTNAILLYSALLKRMLFWGITLIVVDIEPRHKRF